MKLYSKGGAVGLIRSMILHDRLSHAYIICGEKGVGKKTLAKYIAKQILCESESGEPCENCKSCRMIEHSAHPDFIAIEPSGKTGNYLSDDLRPIVADANTVPNEGKYKIYFLPSADKALPAAQNTLLKVIEEPPKHVIFIMTAESREKILSTILSRAISLNISEASKSECLSALTESGASEEEAKGAIAVFGGNIGKCLDYINDDGAKRLPAAVEEIVDALAKKDEYALLRAFSALDKDRELCLEALAGFKTVLRDASAIKLGGDTFSVCAGGAKKLSEKLRQSSIERIYDEVASAEGKIGGNASIQLTLSCLCGRIISN